jgi:serine/threonine-protein kinase HipA
LVPWLAQSAGFTVPHFQVVTDRGGARGLLIERFDCAYANDAAIRHPVEDASQVLGIYPAAKYPVSAEEMSISLIRHCQSKKVAARSMFRLFLFVWLTGNVDLHAKNASIVIVNVNVNASGEWRIAPIYDVPSTLPFGDHTMALSLGGSDQDLSRKSFLQFADTIGLPATAVNNVIEEMLIATEPVAQLFEARVEPLTRSRNAQALAQIEYRRRLLLAS